ncbi:hypothetical protein D3C78_679140 [compost metagenome]
MQLNDFLAQCQSQARPAFLASHLNERFKDPSLLTVGNAFTSVFDTNDYPFGMPPGMQANAAGRRRVA